MSEEMESSLLADFSEYFKSEQWTPEGIDGWFQQLTEASEEIDAVHFVLAMGTITGMRNTLVLEGVVGNS